MQECRGSWTAQALRRVPNAPKGNFETNRVPFIKFSASSKHIRLSLCCQMDLSNCINIEDQDISVRLYAFIAPL